MKQKFEKRKCADCGKLFSPKREWAKFCSTECRNDHGNRIRKEALNTVRAMKPDAMPKGV